MFGLAETDALHHHVDISDHDSHGTGVTNAGRAPTAGVATG